MAAGSRVDGSLPRGRRYTPPSRGTSRAPPPTWARAVDHAETRSRRARDGRTSRPAAPSWPIPTSLCPDPSGLPAPAGAVLGIADGLEHRDRARGPRLDHRRDQEEREGHQHDRCELRHDAHPPLLEAVHIPRAVRPLGPRPPSKRRTMLGGRGGPRARTRDRTRIIDRSTITGPAPRGGSNCTLNCAICTAERAGVLRRLAARRLGVRRICAEANPPRQELGLEGVAMEPQEPCRLGLVPAHALEDAEDDLPLELLPGLPEREHGRAAERTPRIGQAPLVGEKEVEGEVAEL